MVRWISWSASLACIQGGNLCLFSFKFGSGWLLFGKHNSIKKRKHKLYHGIVKELLESQGSPDYEYNKML